MPKVKVNDIHIYYEIHGEGEPLVLIPGLYASTINWSYTIPSLSQHFKVIAFDNRGAGQSDKPDILYTMEMMVDDIAGLLDALGIKETHIFGISLGGMIAQNFALKYPQRVINLILGCTHCGGSHIVSLGEDVRSQLDPENFASQTPKERVLAGFALIYNQEFIDSNPQLIEERVAYNVQNPPDPIGQVRQFGISQTHDTYEHLADIKMPTLVITGGDDKLIHADNSKLLASKIPNSELVILENMGHGFFTESSEETNRIVLDFLR